MQPFVIATAGHVDHGKSSLVKRLTGLEPDRWEEERRRGLTIDLGFVWTRTPGARDVAFVDVPGHERFLSNALAGVGPAPAVMLVVAADEGWSAQTSDHRDAINGFGIPHGLIVLSKSDRPHAPGLRERIAAETAGTTLENFAVIEASAHTGQGIDNLLAAIDKLLAGMPAADEQARVRLWLDRSFSISGAGTVVTGTLSTSTIHVGDHLQALSAKGIRKVTVRSLQSEERSLDSVRPVARVALNLREVAADELGRGDALISPSAWHLSTLIDVRRTTGAVFERPPAQLTVHIGTAELVAQVRRLDNEHLRLQLARELPLELGDRLVLRKPGDRHVYASVAVMDVDPPALERRGAAARRAADLATQPIGGKVAQAIARYGAIQPQDLRRYGYEVPAEPPRGVIAFRGWWANATHVVAWGAKLKESLAEHLAANPLSPGLSRGAALGALKLPSEELLALAVAAAKLEQTEGAIRQPASTVDLGAAEAGIRAVEEHLAQAPFAAPGAQDLEEWQLGGKELAAAERAGRILRLREGIVLLPDAPARARAILAQLEQPFSTSAAKQALNTTRRVAIPLLEYMDEQGLTRRVDNTTRRVR